MIVKNNSKRLITINLQSGNVAIIPTMTAKLSAKQVEEIQKNKIVKAWFKDGDLSEVKEKPQVTAEIIAYSTAEALDANYGIRELQAYAKEAEIEGYSNLDKQALIALLKQ